MPIDKQPNREDLTGSTDQARNPIDTLADEFVARLRQGEFPSVTEYAQRHPELAEELQEVLPTLAMLERCGEDESADEAGLRGSGAPEQLGEYQIIREVARGGMGIVYEAEHDTMGRRVALKVLPAQMANRGSHLQRFHREARAAGRLHHTNIVPVFEVGADRGFYYYAMQFIQGQSLDVVFDELRRLQKIDDRTEEATSDGRTARSSLADSLSKSVAWNLKTGHFDSCGLAVDADVEKTLVRPRLPITERMNATADSPFDKPDSVSSSLHSGTSLKAQSELVESSAARDSYFHRVANIGLQVADALSYAHGQGVLHRDIKPSNIILDTAGVAWVADFGLAKNDDDDLTQSGDIVGTFRYMAPERFKGDADVRCDVYGLGLTLYELCSLRPAFMETDRFQLINVITTQDPIRPRRLNPQVPRDLETIILKAIDRQPNRRYASARELAEDLQRFLSDRPVLARRSSLAEQVWRLCRRNPLPTALVSCLMVLLLLIVGGSIRFGYLNQQQANDLRSKTNRALKAERKAVEANRLATNHLYKLSVGRAESGRFSGRIGQNFATMASIEQASLLLPRLNYSERKQTTEKRNLRNVAIAAMSLIDLQQEREWTIRQPTVVTIDPDFELSAHSDTRGNIWIHKLGAATAEMKLTSPGLPANWIGFNSSRTHLVSRHHPGTNPYSAYVVVWRLKDGKKAFQLRQDVGRCAAAISADGRHVAVGRKRGAVDVLSLDNGSVTASIKTGFDPVDIAFDATGTRLALATSRTVQIWSIGKTEPTATLAVAASASKIAWNSKHHILAVGTTQGRLTVWHDESFELPPWELKPHLGARVVKLAIHPDGEILASWGWDGFIRVNDLSTQEQSLQVDRGKTLDCGFSRDGTKLAYFNNDAVGVWRLSDRPMRVLRSNGHRWRGEQSFHPISRRLLISPTLSGAELWDVRSGEVVGVVDDHKVRCQFTRDGKAVLTADKMGLRRWSIDLQETTPGESLQVTVGKPEQIYKGAAERFSLDAAGRRIAIDSGPNTIVLVDMAHPEEVRRIGPQGGLDRVAVTPDGDTVISSTWMGRDIRVWDWESGELTTKLGPRWGSASIALSPDGSRLSATAGAKIGVWDTESWRNVWQFERRVDDWPGPISFSNDGRFLACSASRYVPQLREAKGGASVAILEAPKTEGVGEFSFSADDGLLAIQSNDVIHLWDLNKLHKRLDKLGLSWKPEP